MLEITAIDVVAVGICAGGITFAYARHALGHIRQKNKEREIVLSQ